mmetsp:Transcript_22567/g.64148  ORF Transcript_22567/g.64148 Transcript_22567/m.64148 type:complete len:285 (+) Transcript_22567:121-975(+)
MRVALWWVQEGPRAMADQHGHSDVDVRLLGRTEAPREARRWPPCQFWTVAPVKLVTSAINSSVFGGRDAHPRASLGLGGMGVHRRARKGSSHHDEGAPVLLVLTVEQERGVARASRQENTVSVVHQAVLIRGILWLWLIQAHVSFLCELNLGRSRHLGVRGGDLGEKKLRVFAQSYHEVVDFVVHFNTRFELPQSQVEHVELRGVSHVTLIAHEHAAVSVRFQANVLPREANRERVACELEAVVHERRALAASTPLVLCGGVNRGIVAARGALIRVGHDAQWAY